MTLDDNQDTFEATSDICKEVIKGLPIVVGKAPPVRARKSDAFEHAVMDQRIVQHQILAGPNRLPMVLTLVACPLTKAMQASTP